MTLITRNVFYLGNQLDPYATSFYRRIVQQTYLNV